MKISVERIIKDGDIGPLWWGMNAEDVARVLPGAIHVIRKAHAGNVPWLDFDGVEFYFDQDFYRGLSGFVVRAWAIKPQTPTRYFDFGWISQRLTYRKVLGNLNRLGWAYLERRYRSYSPFPIIIAEGRAMFAFDDTDNEVPADRYALQKIYLGPGGAADDPGYLPARRAVRPA